MADSLHDNDVHGGEGFFSRWSRRKSEARREETLDEVTADARRADADSAPSESPAVHTGGVELPVAPLPDSPVGGAPMPATSQADTHAGPGLPGVPGASEAPGEPPRLTLADVARLTKESDFTKFIAGDVNAEVKNAALKKLFADPHFNLMDGLDVYIEDYNRTIPVPQSVLAGLMQSKFLGLVNQWADQVALTSPGQVPEADAPMHEPLADAADAVPGDAAPEATPAEAESVSASQVSPDEDADLQLQPDDAARRPGAEPGAGPDGRHEH